MATPRSFLRVWGDRIAGWLLGLPGETTSYTITSVRVPLRDGVELGAELYQPILSGADAKPSGQLLVHGPYGRAIDTAILDASIWAARGYQVLLVSCRGTADSQGQLDPGRTEAADGQDIVKWMQKQPWYTGSFATFGASYLGYTQWALLHEPPADLIACIPSVGPHDYSRVIWGTGAYRLDRITWSNLVTLFDKSAVLGRIRHHIRTQKAVLEVMRGVPLLESIKRYFGNHAPWLEATLSRPDITDEFYKPMQHAEALERVNVPVMLNTGWYDLFLYQTMEQYARLQARGCDVELTIGPWDHAPASGIKIMPAVFAWMEQHVARRGNREKEFPVRVFVTGQEEWKDLPVWPPATTTRKYFLQPGRVLSQTEPTDGDEFSSFTYDPMNPTPSVGGPLLMNGGRAEDTSLAGRADVLAFTSEPLAADVEIAGVASVELHHSSDNPYVDVFVRLSEVDTNGRSHNIAEGFKRLTAGETPGQLKLDMHVCAHKFKPGTRIRLLVAGGTFPLYSRNFGTDESAATAISVRVAKHTIAHNAQSASALLLPVVK